MLIVRLIHLKDIPSYEKVLDSLKTDNSFSEKINDSFAKNLDSESKNFLNEEKDISSTSKNQIKNITQTKAILSSKNIKNFKKDDNFEEVITFQDLINISSRKKEINLKYDLEKNVNLIKFSQGKIDISFNENLDKNFVRNLSEKLHIWTGNRWVITLSKEKGQKSVSELSDIKKKELVEKEKHSDVYKKFKDIFSDGELLEVKKDN